MRYLTKLNVYIMLVENIITQIENSPLFSDTDILVSENSKAGKKTKTKDLFNLFDKLEESLSAKDAFLHQKCIILGATEGADKLEELGYTTHLNHFVSTETESLEKNASRRIGNSTRDGEFKGAFYQYYKTYGIDTISLPTVALNRALEAKGIEPISTETVKIDIVIMWKR